MDHTNHLYQSDGAPTELGTTTPSSTVNIALIMAWITAVTAASFEAHTRGAAMPPLPALTCCRDDSWIPRFVEAQRPNLEELAILGLALTSHIQPGFLDRIISEHFPQGGEFAEFGGARGTTHRGILPTGETAQFILAGHDLERRLAVQAMFSPEHWFWKKRILWLEQVKTGEPVMSGRLILDPELIEEIVTGRVSAPRFSQEFPAERIDTELEWDDLVLPAATMRQIRDIENWIRYNQTVATQWGMERHIKPGYRALFCGPPGTGKTLTVALLGKHTGKPVYRIDLSRIVSKYIGETEQNLARLFDKAENKNWILFFDEADALFGKRTEIRDAHDKYANQEISYLLQRIESFRGLVILASNLRNNIDDAFVRRLQAILSFPIPGTAERMEIWRKTLPHNFTIGDDVDWPTIAAKYELTGANIVNIAHFCAIDAVAHKQPILDLVRLESAIMREYVKEGRVV